MRAEDTIAARIDRVAEEAPDRPAIVDGDTTLTYRDLVDRSAALATVLRDRCQLGAGEVVAVSLPNGWQFPASFLATVGLGAIFMPFNPQWRANEIGGLVRRLGIRTVMTCEELQPVWNEVDADLPRDRILSLDDPAFAAQWEQSGSARSVGPGPASDTQPALYLTTSGSTGRPKVVPRSHANLLAGSRAVAAALGIRPGHRVLSVIPFHHANGFANCLFLPLTQGATTVVARSALPSTLVAGIERERVQIVIASPFLYSLLADAVPNPEAFSSVEIYLSSGAPLPDALATRWRERFGRGIRQLYGSSETGTIAIEEADGPTLPGSAGKVLPTVTVRVVDSAGSPLPSDTTGEIVVRSPAMMNGYVDELELNSQAFADGFSRTGDLGRLTPEGVLVIEGRSKRWINSGGIKVDPVEIENVLHRLACVQYCRVGPERNARDLEVLTVAISLRPGYTASRREIVEHCRKYLAEYKIPRVIRFVDAIATDATGKVPQTL